MDRIRVLVDKLKYLESLDKNCSLHGAYEHRYKLNPCLSLQEVERFEQQYEVKLPDEYRRFILEAGDGGAGPNYGLFPLWSDKRLEHYELLKKPFPHVNTRWSLDEFSEEEEQSDLIDHNTGNIDWVKITQGSLPICHFGCGIFYLLIVTGIHRGTIWWDDLDNMDVIELAEEGTNFFSWYEHWLDSSIEEIQNE